MRRPRKLKLVEPDPVEPRPRAWEKQADGRACTRQESEACWRVVVQVLRGERSATDGLDAVHGILGSRPPRLDDE
jgi:hypothetical protein